MTDWKYLHLTGLSKQFARGPCVLVDITLAVERGTFLCILGPSGSGKSTLVDLIAGFERPTTGTIAYDDRPIVGPGPDRVVVFQDISNALYPWLTALENVEFGLKKRIASRAERRRVAMEALARVGLERDAHKFPSELSGGMKQRAQIARGLVMEPNVLIMDEPFAAVDAITRRHLQDQLKRIWQATGTTIIFVTHDITEALLLGTDVAVLTAGPAATIKASFRLALSPEARPGDPAFADAYRQIEALIETSTEDRG
ncbi:MAG TPA: ABC transporter ATP-binding protein [Candidatus Tectomicrobia bacterium]|nr:ABC transporter ATP-binding protein [Candidatus Tectomicrobia bacterium]